MFLVQETKISLSGLDQAGSNRSVSKPTNNRISSNMEQIKLFVDLNYLILERIRSIQLEMKLLFSCRSMTELTMVTNGFTPYGYGFRTGSKPHGQAVGFSRFPGPISGQASFGLDLYWTWSVVGPGHQSSVDTDFTPRPGPCPHHVSPKTLGPWPWHGHGHRCPFSPCPWPQNSGSGISILIPYKNLLLYSSITFISIK